MSRPKSVSGHALLVWLLVFQFLLQPVLFVLTPLSARAESPAAPGKAVQADDGFSVLAQTTLPPDEEIPGLNPAEQVASPVAESIPAPISPQTGAILGLHASQRVLQAGALVTITLSVGQGLGPDIGGSLLRLDLSPGLHPVDEAAPQRWTVPRLTDGQHFSRTLVLAPQPGAGPIAHTLSLTVQQAEHLPVSDSLQLYTLPEGKTDRATLDLAPDAVEVVIPDSRQNRNRAVSGQTALVSPKRDVMVVMAAGALAPGSVVRYQSLFRRPATASDAAGSGAPGASYQQFLPVLGAGGLPESDQRERPVRLAQDDTDWNNQSVYFHRAWVLQANQNGADVHQFEQPVTLLLPVGDLLAQGVTLADLALWTRSGAALDGEWEAVETVYDPVHEILIAQVSHFSDWGLGAGLTSSGQRLPSMDGVTTDRHTGAATVQIPIEAPTGLGQLTPGVSLVYNSGTADALISYPNDHNYDYRIQAGFASLGWDLAGIPYIATDFSQANTWQMSLHGSTVQIQYDQNTFQYHTNPETFFRIERQVIPYGHSADRTVRADTWIITDPGGVRYLFGGPEHNMQLIQNYCCGPVEEGSRWRSRRTVNRYYLQSVIDPLGNQMTYRYQNNGSVVQGTVPRSCLNGNWSSDRWYHTAFYPTEIQWSHNPTAGISPKMRMRFLREPRDDWQISGSKNEDCDMAIYNRERLSQIYVEVWDQDANTWHTLHRYGLGYTYTPVDAATYLSQRHSILTTVSHYGKGGGPLLNTQRFGYAGVSHYSRLTQVENGQGGVVTYTYGGAEPVTVCDIYVCLYHHRFRRHRVTQVRVDDGLQNWTLTRFVYGNGPRAYAKSLSWNTIKGYQFLGNEYSQAETYARNSSTDVVHVDQQWFYLQQAYGGGALPDPRQGQMNRRRVLAKGVLYLDETYLWSALAPAGGGWQETTSFSPQGRYWVRQTGTDRWTNNLASRQRLFYQEGDQAGYQFGNVTRLEAQDWNGNLLKAVRVQFYPNPDAHLVNLPARITVMDGAGRCASDVRTVFDGQTHYQQRPLSGLATRQYQVGSRAGNGACQDSRVTLDPNAADVSAHQLAYDGVGNIVRRETLGLPQSDGQVTVYDAEYGLFPVRRYPLAQPSLDENARYYGVADGLPVNDGRAYWGSMQSFCEVDDICTVQSYDGFGRPVHQWPYRSNPLPGPGNQAASIRFYLPATAGRTLNSIVEWRSPRCEGNFTHTMYNGLGQLVQERLPAQDWTTGADDCARPDGGQEIYVDYAYDSLGNQTRQSVPHLVDRVTTSDWYRTPDWSQGFTETVYDPLGRPKSIYAPSRDYTTYHYWSGGISTLGRDKDSGEFRSTSWQKLDPLGRQIETREYSWNNGGWLFQGGLRMAYDGADNLTTVDQILDVNQPGVRLTKLTYDLRGFKTAMQDADLGTWSYAYDKRGNLLRQTDARGISTCTDYDSLGRMRSRTMLPGATCPGGANGATAAYQDVNVAYNAKGQMINLSTAEASHQYTYDPAGLVSAETVSIAGAPQAYTTRYAYDAYHRPQTVTYPDGERVTTQYNSLSKAARLTSSLESQPLIDQIRYDGAARLQSMRLPAGGNLWHTRTYWPWTQENGLLRQIQVGTMSGGEQRLSLVYTYDGYGNITRQVDTQVNQASDFGYDQQGRLTQHRLVQNNTGALLNSWNYGFDLAGRLTQMTGASRQFNGQHPYHGIDRFNGRQAFYDANGNLLSDGQTTLQWNRANQLQSVTQSGVTERYAYDSDGARVKKSRGSATTFYVGPHYEVTVQGGVQTVTKYYTMAGMRVAMRESGVLSYLHSDHLGSTLLATNNRGEILRMGSSANQPRYDAYGNQRRSDVRSLPTDYTFSGQKRDDTGLMYMNARYYSPAMGLFLSPDTLVPNPGSVQDFNRYGYVRGNPINRIDPSGHCALAANAADENDRLNNLLHQTQCWAIYYSLTDQGIPGLDWQWDYTLGSSVSQWAAANFATGAGAVLSLFGGLSAYGLDIMGYQLLIMSDHVVNINGVATYHIFVDEEAAYEANTMYMASQPTCVENGACFSFTFDYRAKHRPTNLQSRVDRLVTYNQASDLAIASFLKMASNFTDQNDEIYSGALNARLGWDILGMVAYGHSVSTFKWASAGVIAYAKLAKSTSGQVVGLKKMFTQLAADPISITDLSSRLSGLPAH